VSAGRLHLSCEAAGSSVPLSAHASTQGPQNRPREVRGRRLPAGRVGRPRAARPCVLHRLQAPVVTSTSARRRGSTRFEPAARRRARTGRSERRRASDPALGQADSQSMLLIPRRLAHSVMRHHVGGQGAPAGGEEGRSRSWVALFAEWGTGDGIAQPPKSNESDVVRCSGSRAFTRVEGAPARVTGS
jgi:hypothetical protein